MQLRDYQIRAVDALRASYASGHRAPALVLPTGGGKTLVAAEIVRAAVARGNRVLFLADRTELIDQTVAKLALAGVTDVRVIQAERDTGSPDAPVAVASVQTIRLPRWENQLPPAKLIICDECHHFVAVTYADIIARYPGVLLLGLTATPARRDGKPLGDVFDDLIAPVTVRELTEQGHLVRCQLWAGPPDLKTGQLALTALEAYQRFGMGRLAAVFCRDVKHAGVELETFAAAGIPTAIVTGAMSDRKRAAALAEWRSGKVRVVTSVNCLTEGFDLPELGCAILARRFTHPALYLQVIGRVLRPFPGKILATVVDLCGSAHQPDFGPPDIDREYSLTGKAISAIQKDLVRQCKSCGAMFRAGPRVCPYCAAELPVRPLELPQSVGAGVTELKTAPRPKREYVVKIVSKYRGMCTSCHREFERGDPIYWATLAKKAKHEVCPHP